MLVISQPLGGRGQRLGDYIVQFLTNESQGFDIFRACVAFAKASGVLRLVPALQTFMGRGGSVEIVVGVDEGHTTKQALQLILNYSSSAYVFSNPATTYHPKIYLFESQGKRAVAFVGSSNLTAGGLYTNYEANLGVELDLTIKSDRQTYESILAIFRNAIDTTTGNARQLNPTIIHQLDMAHRLADERVRRGGRTLPHRASIDERDLFPRLPVPPAPRIAPALLPLIPQIPFRASRPTNQEAITAFRPWESFSMILGRRDTQQTRGFSHDVYIPIAARDQNQEFWGWPREFKSGSQRTVGRYQERRVDMLVRPAAGQAQRIDGVRLYYYDIKHEFRLNCGRLVEGARPGDLLVIQKSPIGTLFEGRTYQFEATVLQRGHPSYGAFAADCTQIVANSAKRWGYM